MREELVCTYCAKLSATSDHVPPKLLFSKPRPQLVTVPSCFSCNNRASRDDEYFRTVLFSEGLEVGHSEAKSVASAVSRSLRRPEATGFRKLISSSLHYVEDVSPAGLYLGRKLALSVDGKRLKSVVERITRGLFLHHTGRRLPLETEVKAYIPRGLRDSGIDQILELIKDLRGPMNTIGQDSFSYRYTVAEDDVHSSFWVFVVYQAFTFAAITLDREKVVA